MIITTFSLDLNGILHVTSRERRSGLEKHVTIDNATARFEQEELSAARQRLSSFIEGEAAPAQSAQREAIQAQALIEKAERLMDDANPEDREDLVDNIESVQDALASDDAAALERATDELSDLVFYLES